MNGNIIERYAYIIQYNMYLYMRTNLSCRPLGESLTCFNLHYRVYIYIFMQTEDFSSRWSDSDLSILWEYLYIPHDVYNNNSNNSNINPCSFLYSIWRHVFYFTYLYDNNVCEVVVVLECFQCIIFPFYTFFLEFSFYFFHSQRIANSAWQ